MAQKNRSRREFLEAGFGVAVAGGLVAGNMKTASAGVTAPVVEGPFYPIHEQSERDTDLTHFHGSSARAEGELIIVEGQVLDDAGKPVAGAFVDIWQANAAGRYSHEADTSTAPLDPNFQSWAQMTADAEGRYRFLTIKPGAYPVSDSWIRPPHIHFKVSKRGYHEITTQMFFEGEPLNAEDQLFLGVPEGERDSIIAKLTPGKTKDGEDAMRCRFDVGLKKV